MKRLLFCLMLILAGCERRECLRSHTEDAKWEWRCIPGTDWCTELKTERFRIVCDQWREQ